MDLPCQPRGRTQGHSGADCAPARLALSAATLCAVARALLAALLAESLPGMLLQREPLPSYRLSAQETPAQ